MRSVKSPLRVTIVVAIAVVLIGSVPAAPPQAQDGDCQYFTETGHYVCAEFLEYFETRGGLEIFGYPLTEAFDDRARGLRVQYFQRARMEWHPDNPEPHRVLLGLLVDELGYHFPLATPEQIPAFNDDLRHYFPETGHVVSYAFLHYFREHGGLDIFGYPCSEFMYEDGYTVQYFQRARMELHPENLSGLQIRLTNLGETYVERFGVPGGYDDPRPPPEIGDASLLTEAAGSVIELRVSASVRHIITGQEGMQTVFVYVMDQWQQPVPGVVVTMTVRYRPDEARYVCALTDNRGFTEHSFDVRPSVPGRNVVIDVAATYGGLAGATQAFFLPWW
jgi:hypothetical protein